MNIFFAMFFWTALGIGGAFAQDVTIAANTIAANQRTGAASSILEEASQLLAKSAQLAAAGLRPAAAEAAQASADMLRGVQSPADGQTAYLWLFTQALYTLTVRLIEAGRLDAAAAASHEAVQVARQAAAAPGADVSAIGSLMLSLSAQLAAAVLRPAAVDAAQASADVLRGFQPPSDGEAAYLWLFTQALYTLTVRLIEAGRLDEAATAAHEAIQVARRAAAAPGADASAIASLMLSLSAQLAAAGLRPAAVDAAQASADILREEGVRRKAWGTAMSRIPPPPSKGCFNAAYPKIGWQEVPCVKAPDRPYPPAHGGGSENVGNGTDWTATVAAGSAISSATGSFDSVAGVTGETGSTFGPNCTNQVSNVPNVFSLQLNTKPFVSKPAAIAACQTAAGCQGWQQFIYSSAFNVIFMQYWLLGFGATCPTGWTAFQGSCYQNSNATTVPAQTIANLGDMSLTASANSAFDTVKILLTGDVPSLSLANQDSTLNLAPAWQDAEFNVFGDTCGSQANFNAGSTIVVRTQVNAGARLAPACTVQGFTGETNNLNLVGTPATVQTSPLPAIVFTESNAAGGAPSTCTISRGGLFCSGIASSGSTSCTDAGGAASTCAAAACPQGFTLTGGGGACAAGDRKIKSLFPRKSDSTFTIMCEQQGVDPQAVAICCRF